MQSVYNSNMLLEVLRKFNVKTLIISNVTDEELLDEIKKCNFNVTFINTAGENSINGNPLNILPNLENYDAIFLDGDANWYTVFNELTIIKKSNKEFPLVFVFNNHFPNKRRDSYINPDLIPSKFRHKYKNTFPICFNGEKINISDGYYHACEENTPKNGVSAAIEDFLSTNTSIGVIKLNFINEISILYYKSQINQKRVEIISRNIQNENIEDINLSDMFIENKLLISYINKYDVYNEDLNEYEAEYSKKNAIIEDFENKFKIQDSELDYKENQIKSIESKLSLRDSQIKNVESKLINKENVITNLENQLKMVNDDFYKKEISFNQKINSLENKLKGKSDELSSMRYKLDVNEKNLKNKEEELNTVVIIKNNKIRSLNNQIQDKDLNLQTMAHQVDMTLQELNDKEKELDSLQNGYAKQFSRIDNNEYCLSCFKNEISNNKLEINYLQNNTLIKNISRPLAYLYLIFKSNPKEISLNFKLYRALKDSNCFDIGFYLNKNKDLIGSKWCKYFSPELHYVCNGFNEERIFNKKYFNRNSKKDLLEYILTCDK